MLKKILDYAFYIVVLCTALALARSGYNYLSYYETKRLLATNDSPSYIHSGDNVPKTIFHAGDVVYLHIESTRPVDCSGQTSLRLLSEHIESNGIHRIIFETFGNNRALIPRGHYILDTRFVIPIYFDKGDYIIERASHYECNSFSVDKTPRVVFTVISLEE